MRLNDSQPLACSQRTGNRLSALGRPQSGAITVLGVGLLLTVLLTSGMILDIQETMAIKGRLAIAVNNAVQMAQAVPEAQSAQIIQKVLRNYFPEGSISFTTKLQPIENGYQLEVTATLPSLFMHHLLGPTTFEVTERAKITTTVLQGGAGGPSKTREVALVLDYSSSMSSPFGGYFGSTGADAKASHMKSALSEAFVEIMNDPEFGKNTRFSVVPYSTGVNIGRHRPWATNPSTGYDCAEDSSTHGATALSLAMNPPETAQVSYTYFAPNYCPAFKLIPLTNDFFTTALLINSSVADGGGTQHENGLIWGARTLLPTWAAAWDEGNPSASEKTEKVIVMLTDGALGYGSKTYFEAGGLCDRIKNEGIAISVIFYGASGDKELFTQCASSGQFYAPTPTSGTDYLPLKEAFVSSITQEIESQKTTVISDY